MVWAVCDVLVLEDDLLLRMTFADILSDEGYAVREAANAAEAWAVLREPAGVRVLLADKDLGAPPREPDGFAVAMEALRLHPALIVIYASAQLNALGGRALTARERVLPKPFTPQALVALAREVTG